MLHPLTHLPSLVSIVPLRFTRLAAETLPVVVRGVVGVDFALAFRGGDVTASVEHGGEEGRGRGGAGS